MRVHILEAGFEGAERPLILLLHGFPELAFSWRKIIGPLAAAGFHVVAPDLRGYGRTTHPRSDQEFAIEGARILSFVADALALVAALGRTSIASIVGHDFGSPVAAWCALTRPDVFSSVVLMSAPFGGAPSLPFDTDRRQAPSTPRRNLQADLAALPRPRKHYVDYFATPQSETDMMQCPQGLRAFLRAYYHVKSGDWPGNRPHMLQDWSATELAKLPTYYVMNLAEDMPATVAASMPSETDIAACRWLTQAELDVYASEFERTGFRGGLNCYRSLRAPDYRSELVFSGRTVDVPSMFIAGKSDWGIHQSPGAFEAMSTKACTRFYGAHVIDCAGHWVQQERPSEVVQLILDFLNGLQAG
jgi:pimeloyl-ACP methyl ester carboxylesterase